MRRALTLVATAAVVLGLAACGEKHDTLTAPAGSAQPFTLMLDYFPNAAHVGLYQALAPGDFAQAGLDVHVQTPSDPSSPLKLLRLAARSARNCATHRARTCKAGHLLLSV